MQPRSSAFYILFIISFAVSLSLPLVVRAESTNPSFSALKNTALNKSREIQSLNALVTQKQAAVWSSWTRWLPRVDGQLSQSRSKDYSLLNMGSFGLFSFTPQETELKSWALVASLPVYKRSVDLGLRQSYTDLNLARTQLESKQREIDWHLRSLYSNYLLELYREAALKKSIEVADKSLKETDLRFRTGSRTRVDLLRAESNLLQLQSKELLSASTIRQARLALVEFVGLTESEFLASKGEERLRSEPEIVAALDQTLELDRTLALFKPMLDLPEEKWNRQIEERSATLAAVRSDFESNRLRATQLMAAEYPDLSLKASMNKQASEWSRAFESGNESYSIGLTLSLPIFSFGSFFSSRSEMVNSQLASELKFAADSQKLQNEVRVQYQQAIALLKTLESLTRNLQQNEEIEKLSFKSYQLGKATMTELLQAQNGLLDAKVNLAKSKIDLVVLLWQLSWNLGWETS